MTDRRLINVRVTQAEADLLAAYARAMGRTKTDVVRAFIRSLEGRLHRKRYSYDNPGMDNPG